MPQAGEICPLTGSVARKMAGTSLGGWGFALMEMVWLCRFSSREDAKFLIPICVNNLTAKEPL
jgi:hypothetical protein